MCVARAYEEPEVRAPVASEFFGDDLWRMLGTKGGTESETDQAQLPHRTTGRSLPDVLPRRRATGTPAYSLDHLLGAGQ